eukprot:6026580-Prorocentrum_lima.AAC.1
MTSSLVGSEMCIRDRLDAAPAAPVGVSSSALSGALLLLVLGRVRPAAVSYTHLTLPTICSV